MTTETEKAINVLIQHFLLEEEKTKEQILAAFEHMAAAVQTSQDPFRAMGVAALQAMLNKNLSSLHGRKAVLIADLPIRGPLQ
ncbi:MAG TPA: hypothetical protein VFS89_08435 [Nitrosospira sp.]|nr:hypothetical protein [Nitrosospira sp.]